MPDPRINFKQLQLVNAKRPQTSYGGISARQRNRKKKEEKNEPHFPEPEHGGMFGFHNNLLEINDKIN